MALGARSWSTLFFEYRLELDVEKHLYSSVENEMMLGDREKRPEATVEEVTEDGEKLSATYTGEWKKDSDVRHGKGKMQREDGLEYEGFYQLNQKTGKGILKFPKNDLKGREMYKGSFFEDKMHGPGTMHYSNGCRLNANWVNGELEDQGVYTFMNGVKVRVTFEGEDLKFEDQLFFPDSDIRI